VFKANQILLEQQAQQASLQVKAKHLNPNMAYINIATDGHRPVGPLGIKKAEQELIKRRYK